jgi:hypothetical protein
MHIHTYSRRGENSSDRAAGLLCTQLPTCTRMCGAQASALNGSTRSTSNAPKHKGGKGETFDVCERGRGKCFCKEGRGGGPSEAHRCVRLRPTTKEGITETQHTYSTRTASSRVSDKGSNSRVRKTPKCIALHRKIIYQIRGNKEQRKNTTMW